jgi:hypothetical protein
MLEDLKANNRRWAAAKLAVDPGFFQRLAGQQSPEFLWIGWQSAGFFNPEFFFWWAFFFNPLD